MEKKGDVFGTILFLREEWKSSLSRVLSILLLLVFSATISAQAPHSFTYQAVVRNGNDVLVRNQTVGVAISIHQGTPSGSVVYSERHTPTTNNNGLFSIMVGQGSDVVGSVVAIDWSNGPFYLSSSIDLDGGTDYDIETTQQILSVPYSLFADSCRAVSPSGLGDVLSHSNNADANNIVNVLDPNDPQDAATKHYVDSLLSLITAFLDASGRDTVACIAEGSSLRWHGRDYDATGLYTFRIPGVGLAGTDSVIRLHLTVRNPSASTDTRVECDSLLWIDGNKYFADNNNANITLTDADGCDSVVTLNLTIHHASDGYDSIRSHVAYTWIDGNTYNETDTTSTHTLVKPDGCDSVVHLYLIINAGQLEGRFSVSDDDVVFFSQGNLQYQASSNTWRFAEHQYDYIGTDEGTGNAATLSERASQSKWIDLFAWGTSGWNSGARCYLPYDGGASSDDYCPGDNNANSLTHLFANADWGVYNAISNGGDMPDMWRTLTSDEWQYLLMDRTTENNVGGMMNARFCYATVNDVFGLIIFPDQYTHPAGVTEPEGVNSFLSCVDATSYMAADWQKIENAGAVFLPCAGYTDVNRSDMSGENLQAAESRIRDVDMADEMVQDDYVDCEEGYYWSTTTNLRLGSKYLLFGSLRPLMLLDDEQTNVAIDAYDRSRSMSVRLVRDVNRVCSYAPVEEIVDLHDCDGITWHDSTYIYSTDDPIYVTTTANGCDSVAHLHFTSSQSNAYGYLAMDESSFVWQTSGDYGHGTGNTYTSNGVYVGPEYMDDNSCPSADTLHLAFASNGMLLADFTVAPDTTVRMSKGNLQYQSSSDTWRFAEHQYDIIGAVEGNSNPTESQTVWIDLFSWGTSTWSGGVVPYMPYQHSATKDDYFLGGDYRNSLTGLYGRADWGINNAITNGGGNIGQWYTLSANEWKYLLQVRSASTIAGVANARYCGAMVNGVKGILIFPDEFVMPSTVHVPAGINAMTSLSDNIYDLHDWNLLEVAGATFLPAAGWRNVPDLASDSGPLDDMATEMTQFTNNNILQSVQSNVSRAADDAGNLGMRMQIRRLGEDGVNGAGEKLSYWTSSSGVLLPRNSIGGGGVGGLLQQWNRLTPAANPINRASDKDAVIVNESCQLTTDSRYYGNAVRLVTMPNRPCQSYYPLLGVDERTACDSLVWHGVMYKVSTDEAQFFSKNASGCDSITTLHLTIIHADNKSYEHWAMNSYTWPTSGVKGHGTGSTYDSSRVYIGPEYNGANGCSTHDTLHLIITPSGTLSSLFSVDDGVEVAFSQGNLQYQPSTGSWRFAEHQYDTLGIANNNISLSYTGWIDLYGWGTSGWNSGANAYQPYSVSTTASDYYVGGSANSALTLTNSRADWGVFNAIGNGGNDDSLWRTLNYNEWSYLLNDRAASTVGGTADARYCNAQVAGVNGMILFPDHYTHPADVATPVSINTQGSYGSNIYTVAQWEKMQQSGAVFLPAAGYRMGNTTSRVGSLGYYWLSSIVALPLSETYSPEIASVNDGQVEIPELFGNSTDIRMVGLPIRLVRIPDNPCLYGHLIRTEEIDHSSCDQYAWHDSIYRESTTAYYRTTTAHGCDSLVVLNLTIIKTQHKAYSHYERNTSFTWDLNGDLGHGNDVTYNTIFQDGVFVSNRVGMVTGTSYLDANGCIATDTLYFSFNDPGTKGGVFTTMQQNSLCSFFAAGNLQYQPSTGTWSFADQQYDFVGNELGNVSPSSSQSNLIDLFGWGTSGQNTGSVAYYPYSTSTRNTDYTPFGNPNSNLNASESPSPDWANSDVTIYYDYFENTVSGGLFNTPSASTMNYILNQRKASRMGTVDSARFCKATVAGVTGMIIFPDVYRHPYTVTLPDAINDKTAPFSSNDYTEDDWMEMEDAGAVFLPTAGMRSGVTVSNVNHAGYYWTSTHATAEEAFSLYFSASNTESNLSAGRSNGHAVRLIGSGILSLLQ